VPNTPLQRTRKALRTGRSAELGGVRQHFHGITQAKRYTSLIQKAEEGSDDRIRDARNREYRARCGVLR